MPQERGLGSIRRDMKTIEDRIDIRRGEMNRTQGHIDIRRGPMNTTAGHIDCQTRSREYDRGVTSISDAVTWI